jgi:16S rRNA (guanine966-N2)-methyltransferase
MRGPWTGATVLDLYSGSGAFALEAASRGAARVDLVESDRRAVAIIARNRDAVLASGTSAQVEIHHAKVERWVSSRPQQEGSKPVGYDVVFCDPPYATAAPAVAAALADLAVTGSLNADGLFVLERSSRSHQWRWPDPFSARWDRRYGEAHVWIAGFDNPTGHRNPSDSVATC